MIRNFIAISLAAVAMLAAQGAHADWLMLGAYDFQPYDYSTDYKFAGGRGGYVNSGFSSVKASVRIPAGKTFVNMLCQVVDFNSTADVTITLGELSSTDNSTTWGERSMITMSSSGTPGHVKLLGDTISGSAVVNNWSCPNTCYYYTYYLTARLPGGFTTSIKSCAIQYN